MLFIQILFPTRYFFPVQLLSSALFLMTLISSANAQGGGASSSIHPNIKDAFFFYVLRFINTQIGYWPAPRTKGGPPKAVSNGSAELSGANKKNVFSEFFFRGQSGDNLDRLKRLFVGWAGSVAQREAHNANTTQLAHMNIHTHLCKIYLRMHNYV